VSTGGFLAGMPGGKAKLRLWERDSGVCHLCGQKVNNIIDATRDHIVPLSQGGCTCGANIALAHRSCNNRRGSTEPACRLGVRSQRRRKGHRLEEHPR
jgi:5-methylcytosine-specific restriction endonuclease McrA